MKRIFRIFGFTIIAALFIGTLVFLWKKAQAKPVVYRSRKSTGDQYFKENCCNRISYPAERDRDKTPGVWNRGRNIY